MMLEQLALPTSTLAVLIDGDTFILPLDGIVPTDWDEDRTTSRPLLYLRAESYVVERLFDVPPAKWTDATEANYAVSPQGNFAYCNRILPQGIGLKVSTRKHGVVGFDGDVVLPTLLENDKSRSPGQEQVVWMSLTPNEMMTQRSGIHAAKGTVVVGGLGLGWFLRKVCERPSVERVILVERSQELLDWYGTDLCHKYPKVTDVICDDVYSQIGRHGDARYLFDIWPDQGDARKDRRFVEAKRGLKNRLWGWGWSAA